MLRLSSAAMLRFDILDVFQGGRLSNSQNIRFIAFLMSFSRWLRSATSSPVTEDVTLAMSVVIRR